MTRKQKNEEKKKQPEPMVIYECPYCLTMSMKSLIDIENEGTWHCIICKKPLGLA